jgi:hypothetical protein
MRPPWPEVLLDMESFKRPDWCGESFWPLILYFFLERAPNPDEEDPYPPLVPGPC